MDYVFVSILAGFRAYMLGSEWLLLHGGLLHTGMHPSVPSLPYPVGVHCPPLHIQLALTASQITPNVSLRLVLFVFIAVCFQSEPRILLSPHLAFGCYTHLMGPVTFAWFLGS